MVKIIDIDELFNKYISDYVYENIGKVTPEEIENNMPVLYDEFGRTAIKELNGKTPATYYIDFTANELLRALEEHIDKGVSVSDFLCEAITGAKDAKEQIVSLIKQEKGEEFTLYLLNMAEQLGIEGLEKRYLEFVLFDYGEPIRELATELLVAQADQIKEDVLQVFDTVTGQKRACLTEILSGMTRDDRVFNALINEFVAQPNNISLYAYYLSKYGDERALPFLLTAIENEKINYHDFEELRFAIETLGGVYDKKRDFSKDKFYKKIKGDLFNKK